MRLHIYVWMVVLHFSVGGIEAAVHPKDRNRAFVEESACKRAISAIRKSWERRDLPSPERISCEKIEVVK